jgi:hypothetical protein
LISHRLDVPEVLAVEAGAASWRGWGSAANRQRAAAHKEDPRLSSSEKFLRIWSTNWEMLEM